MVKIGMGPFSVTSTGLVLTLVAAWFVWDGSYLAGIVFLIAGSILDAVDGEVARMKNKATKAGAIFDSSFDRTGELLVLAALLAGEAGSAHPVLVYLVPAAIGGSYMVSYIRARAEGVGLSCSNGLFTRTERLVLTIAGLLAAGLWDSRAIVVTMAVLAAGAWFTAGQRLTKVIRDGRGVSLDE